MANMITVLTNNIILIGNTEETQGGILVDKPHSIQNTGTEYLLTPFLEKHIGQSLSQTFIKNEHILTSVVAENNELLQAYLKKISGIQLEDKQIILG